MSIYACRVDSNKFIGSGHITRCINFAKNFNNIKFIFIVSEIDKYYLNILKKQNFKIIFIKNNKNSKRHENILHEVMQINKILKLNKVECFFIDLYNCSTFYTRSIYKEFKNTCLIESEIKRKHKVRKIINIFNTNIPDNLKIFFNTNSVKILNNCQAYFIDNYFKKKKLIKNNSNNKIVVAISFGAVDKHNLTYKLTKIFADKKFTNYNFNIIIGLNNMNFKSIDKFKTKNIKIFKNPKNFNQIISNSNIYIGAAGMTLYEILYLKIPSIVINTNKKQNKFVDYLRSNKVITSDFYYRNVKNKQIEDSFYKLVNNNEIRKKVLKNIDKLFYNKSKLSKISEILNI